METNIIVRLFQSVKPQKNESTFTIQKATHQGLILKNNATLSDTEYLGKIHELGELVKKEEVKIKDEIAHAYTALSVDEQLQIYLCGINEWGQSIRADDIVKLEFNTCATTVKDKLKTVDSILLVHKMPK